MIEEKGEVVDVHVGSTLPFPDVSTLDEGCVGQATSINNREACTKPTNETISDESTRRGATQCIRSIPERWPRSCACVGGIVLPLWLLVLFTLLGGKILAHFEAPQEYETNDAILANKNALLLSTNRLSETIDELLDLPLQCLLEYTPEGTNMSFHDLLLENPTTEQDNLNLSTLSILAQLPGLRTHMLECGSDARQIVDTLLEIQSSTSLDLASQSVTFNWIRCWNETEYGSHLTFRADDRLLEAASNQAESYTETWQRNQQYLYNLYIEDFAENITDFERLDAWKRAINDATGSNECSGNVAGSAWFFFTVMTTIGYGNQVIQTASGRALVGCLGFFSILAFGAMSAAASQILMVVFDDFVARWNLKVLSRPAVGILIWTFTALSWTIFVAFQTYKWWQDRLPESEQPYPSFWDSVWFAYLTTTTIGLGDFYYQPAYLFVEDIFALSMRCLICFVFFATLISHIGALLSGFFPDAVGKLRSRVERTNLTNTQLNEQTPVETQLIKILQELLAEDSHDSLGGPPSLSVIVLEEELLKKVLAVRVEERQRVADMGST